MIFDEILNVLKRKGNNIAYTINQEKYTYDQLYMFVSNIYNWLLDKNLNKKPVIVYGHKEVYMKASFLACSLAGMTYVPIDESLPKERVESIISQTQAELIIGDFEYNNIYSISKKEINKIMNDDVYTEIEEIYLNLDDICYMIFTSGSTGVPKGVKVTYKNLNSCIKWLKHLINVDDKVILNQALFSFDLSVADLYLSLISNSEHFILESGVQTDFKLLFENLKFSNAHIAVITPSFADLLLLDKSFNEELMPNLETIIFCGEKLLPATVQKIYSRFENINIINFYGPTECTFAVTSIEISLEMANNNDIPVGKSKRDVEIYIIDEQLNELEEGNIGEILIVGDSVADGYVDCRQNDSFIIYNNENAYRTGDLGYLKNGILYYKCRKDKQLKYKGYRIELDDIENNIYKLEYIEKVVIACKMTEEEKVQKIIAFVKLKDNILKKTLEIRSDLSKRLPSYMCPIIKIVNEFPLNRNGKCDKKKLMEEYC